MLLLPFSTQQVVIDGSPVNTFAVPNAAGTGSVVWQPVKRGADGRWERVSAQDAVRTTDEGQEASWS